ncbi:EamA family transporter, partial [Xanthovirga aplysinae]|uniref:EamA family transporter n=1 Tax=Xanthovirga aplysinae TaxID=2529853 RepID=UPI0016572BDB|nr:EamA family transporter [Xanthovirga aplysinae]
MGILIPTFLFATAQTRLDSAISGVLNVLTPILVLVIGTLTFKQKVDWKNKVGIIVGFIVTSILMFAGSKENR